MRKRNGSKASSNGRRQIYRTIAAANRDLEKAEKLEESAKHRIWRAQARCDHPVDSVVQGEYHEYNLGGCDRPFFVCRLCGYAEESWGAGLFKLEHAEFNELVPKLSHDAAWKFVRTYVSQDDMDALGKFGKKRAREYLKSDAGPDNVDVTGLAKAMGIIR